LTIEEGTRLHVPSVAGGPPSETAPPS
jgi:hypothetical protein